MIWSAIGIIFSTLTIALIMKANNLIKELILSDRVYKFVCEKHMSYHIIMASKEILYCGFLECILFFARTKDDFWKWDHEFPSWLRIDVKEWQKAKGLRQQTVKDA